MRSHAWRREWPQVRAISRATFDGFLQNDLMPPGMQATALIWAAAFLVAPAVLLPAQLLGKYSFLRRFYPDRVEPALWNDRALFILLSAGAIGVVAVVLWETLLPARRDVFVLGPLPVASRVQSMGRLGGLLCLFAAFAAGLNAITSVIFPVVTSGTLRDAGRWAAAHLIATVMADAFVFFSMTTLQGVVILAVGRRAAERLATIMQTIVVMALLLTLLFIGPVREAVGAALAQGNAGHVILRWFPLAWFVGLYEALSGTTRPVMNALAWRALAAGVAPLAATIGLYAIGYGRLAARALETPDRSTGSMPVVAFARLVRFAFVRRGEEQAVCAFVLRVVSRSSRHRMLTAAYVGGAVAIILATLISAFVRAGAGLLAEPSVATLSPPLILGAGLVVASRVLLAIPADLPAKWVFECMPLSPVRIGAGAHKAVLLISVPTVALVALAPAMAMFGWRIAWQHTLFSVAMTVLLSEVLLLRFRGFPCARPYVPGRSRFHLLWPAYLTAFTVYTYTAAESERLLLRSGGLLTLTEIIAGLAAVVAARRIYLLHRLDAVTFESDLPDTTFAGFNLSEGLAAQPRRG